MAYSGESKKQEILRLLSDGEWRTTRAVWNSLENNPVTFGAVRERLHNLRMRGYLESRKGEGSLEWRLKPHKIIVSGVMTGFGIRIRQLQPEDVERFEIDLQGNPVEQCVAVYGVDLGECLAAVVLWDEQAPKLLWSDDAEGNEFPSNPDWKEEDTEAFCWAVITISRAVHPHLRDV